MTGTHLDITERIQMEQALRESEARYRAYVENAPEAIFVVDASGRYIDVNQAASVLTGYSREELLGMGIVDLGVAGKTGNPSPTFQRLRDEGRVRTDIVLRKKGGGVMNVTLHGVALDGRRFMAFCTDITERKRTEQQLRIKDLAIESATSAIGLADLEGHILDVNPSFLRLLEFSDKAEVIGRGIWETADSPERVDAVMAEVMAHGATTGEGGIIRSDGVRVDVEYSVSLVRDETGVPLCLMASFLDISSRLESKRLLQLSDGIIQAIPSGLFLYRFEPPDRLILVKGNPAAKMLTGVDPEAWVGHEFNEIWPNARSLGHTDRYLKVVRTGEVFETEELTYKDARLEGAFRIRAFRLAGSQLVVAFENMTERKRAEAALIAEKERAQLYLDISRVMFIALNTDGVVTLANKRACEILEWPEEEIVGKNWFKHFLPRRMRSEILGVSTRLFKGEIAPVEYYENPVLCRSGQERLIAWHNATIHDESGRIIGLLSSGEDITERKATERELAEKMETLSRFNRLMVGRELRMAELKREVNALLERLSESPKYSPGTDKPLPEEPAE